MEDHEAFAKVDSTAPLPRAKDRVRLFLCGDVMTGRGVDQILSHPCDPPLYESYAKDARDYVRLAESAHGAIPKPVADRYIWGAALAAWDRAAPDVRIVNLETAATRSHAFWQGKGIHYRMSPQNATCLRAAAIDCCALANNHVLDWGHAGLTETLQTLAKAGLRTAGAGENQVEAQAPAVLPLRGKGRVVVFSWGSPCSGIPPRWAAGQDCGGVNLLPDFSGDTVKGIQQRVAPYRKHRTVVVASLHWGPNWSYSIPLEQRRFAHRLIDEAGVDIVHGHSSHHAKGIEVYHDRLILYGCGDFITDYEGIAGQAPYRGDLALMYFADIAPASGQLLSLRIKTLQVHRMQLREARAADVTWARKMLNREGRRLGTRCAQQDDQWLKLYG